MKTRLRWLVACGIALAVQSRVAMAKPSPNIPAQNVANSLVWVVTEQRLPVPQRPWEVGRIVRTSVVGAVVEPGWIVVPAHVVKYATRVVMHQEETGLEVELHLQHMEEEVDVAFLTPPVLNGSGLVSKMPFLQSPFSQSSFKAVYIRDDQSPVSTNVRLGQFFIRTPPNSHYPLVTYSVEAENSIHSGVLLSEGFFAGLIFPYENQILVVQAEIIQHIVQDVLFSKTYRGFSTLALQTTSVAMPSTWAWLGASFRTGVQVKSVSEASPLHGVVQPNDVLLAIDGHEIDREGLCGVVGSPRRVPWTWYIQQKFPGDAVWVRFLHQGRVNATQVSVLRHNSTDNLVPPTASDYLLVGGVLLVELSEEYLRSFGINWKKRAPEQLLYPYLYENNLSPNSRRKVVVVSSVFPDVINQSYEFVEQEIVTRINGQPVESLQQVAASLRTSPVKRQGKSFVTLETEKSMLVFAYEELARAQARIQNAYGIPSSAQAFVSAAEGRRF